MNSQERKNLRYQRRQEHREDNTELSDIITFSNLLNAFDASNKGSRKKKRSNQKFSDQALFRAYEISEDVESGSIYHSQGTYPVDILDRGRERHITAPHLEERIVQKCFNDNYLHDKLTKSVVNGNIGNIKGKGLSIAVAHIKQDIKRAINRYGTNCHIATFDFEHYFDNIEPNKASKIVSKNTKNILVTKQIEEFCKHEEMPFGAPFSQLVGVVYPNSIDHAVKERYHVTEYGRYVDDGYVIRETEEELEEILQAIDDMGADLGLKLNKKKTRISKITNFRYLKLDFHVAKSGKITTSIVPKKMKAWKEKFKKLNNKYRRGEISYNKLKEFYISTTEYIDEFGSRKNSEEFVNYTRYVFGGKIK